MQISGTSSPSFCFLAVLFFCSSTVDHFCASFCLPSQVMFLHWYDVWQTGHMEAGNRVLCCSPASHPNLFSYRFESFFFCFMCEFSVVFSGLCRIPALQNWYARIHVTALWPLFLAHSVFLHLPFSLCVLSSILRVISIILYLFAESHSLFCERMLCDPGFILFIVIILIHF